MDSSSGKRLLSIARKLRDLAQEIENLANETQIPNEKKITRPKARDIVIDAALVENLKGRGREGTREYLIALNHKQLGSIIRALGGPSEETKRTKEMILERILYRMFDYSTGHKIMKGEIEG